MLTAEEKADIMAHPEHQREGDHRTGNDGKGYYIRTFTGKQFYWDTVETNDFDIRDIAHSLSMNCRWTGHVKHFYSVAQHSIYASQEAENIGLPTVDQMSALLHDASEAYMHDTPSPLKWHLKQNNFTAFADLEKRVDIALFKAFGLPYPRNPLIKEIDLRLLSTEKRQLMPPGGEADYMLPPYEWRIREIMPDVVEGIFLRRFAKLRMNLR